MTKKQDRFAHLTVDDLQLIARARGLDLPEDADRAALIALLNEGEASGENVPTEKTTGKSPMIRAGWWTSLSVSALRAVARDHGIDIPAGVRRHELVELLIEHDVPRPSRTSSRSSRRAR